MRTTKALLIAAAIGASSLITEGNAFATDAVTVSANNANKKVKVLVTQPKLQDISIQVANTSGEVIYQEDIQARSTYGKVYDLSDLEDGTYTFTSTDEYITTTKKIKVEGSSATEISKEATYRPVFLIKDKYLKVQFYNQNKEDIEFTVESSGTLFHENKAGNDPVFGAMLDVSKMPKGKYYARMKVGNKDYYYPFER